MEEVKKNNLLKKITKIMLFFLLGLLSLLLVTGIALTLPSVQTRLGQYATQWLNKEFKTDITVQQVNFTIFGGVKLKRVLAKDYKKDTLIYIKTLKTTILDLKKLQTGDLHFDEIRLDSLLFKIKNYKNEKQTNLDKFVALFDDGKPSKTNKPFLLTAKKINLTSSYFSFVDQNNSKPLLFEAKNLQALTYNLLIKGPKVSTNIKQMSFIDNRNLVIENLSSNFSYSPQKIDLDQLEIQTPQSTILGNFKLKYNLKDFADFNNKVIFDVKIKQANLSTNDLKLFYKEFNPNQTLQINGNLYGTLNHFATQKLQVTDSLNSKITGNFIFKNLLTSNSKDFYINGKSLKITTSYPNLKALLPKIVASNLPIILKKLGRFTFLGQTQLTAKNISTNSKIQTALGNLDANLQMTSIDNLKKTTYKGNVKLLNFDLGNLLNEKKLGKVTLNLDIDGKGFKEKDLKTSIKGEINNIYFNKYNYTNIVVDGTMDKSIFNGKINTNDPNLILDFQGNLDLRKQENKYDFRAKVEYANLKKLNLFTASPTAIFRGDVTMNLHGNTIDAIYGNVFINKTSYENNKDIYFFDDFQIQSTFDTNQVRTITINSPDIIEGRVEGKFKFKQLSKLIENSLGSLYANYSPNKVNKGQFIKFDFTVYSKLIEVFFPDIALGENTSIHGLINSDNDEFKFNFKSPNITAYNNKLDNITIKIDNKNPLYNAYIELDSIKTKNYKISNFSLINVTANDTLFFRTECRGGKKGEDFYNINLYHTINKENKSVVGIKKSDLNFKNSLWHINEKDQKDNQLVFNKKLTDFSIEKLTLSHKNQVVELMGQLKDSTYKDLKLSFKDVALDKITPTVDNLKINGKLNGVLDIKQRKSIYEPTSTLQIDSLSINNYHLGILDMAIKGDTNLQNFEVNTVLKKNGNTSFTANGNIMVESQKTQLDLNLNLNQLNIEPLSPLGGSIITNIRGLASGSAKMQGDFNNPTINGRLYLNDAGLKFPYLNIDYNLKEHSVIDFSENQFVFKDIILTDSKYKKNATLDGTINHTKFADWYLNLALNSNNMLVLDTPFTEDAMYYGTAFVNGTANIKGPINGLVIGVNAASEKGTFIKIPMTQSESSSNKEYIKFTTASTELKDKNNKARKNYDGVELNFELNITPDAEVEVIIDKSTGHALKGRGNGTLLMEINTLGKFNMWGDFLVDKGEYNFKYGGIIDKKLTVKKGGSIAWSGNPFDAILNMEAVYKTEANPAVLLENPSFNKKIPTQVVIRLSDKLMNPDLDIAINFPTVSSVLRSELEYKLSDTDVRQTQAIYLLSTGSFLTEKGVAENAITGNLLERAGSLFEDIFSSSDDKFKLSPFYIQGDKRNLDLQTSGRFGVTLSTQISDKITINGKFGVPVGGLNETVIVGDVEVQLRLNEDGTLNARFFNKENDINYIGEGIGYTQGLGLSYQVDFNTFKELMYKIINTKAPTNTQNKKQKDQTPDSDYSPEFILFSEQRQKKASEKQKPNLESPPDLN